MSFCENIYVRINFYGHTPLPIPHMMQQYYETFLHKILQSHRCAHVPRKRIGPTTLFWTFSVYASCTKMIQVMQLPLKSFTTNQKFIYSCSWHVLISVIVCYMCHLLALNIITIYLDTAANVQYSYIVQFIDIYDMTKTRIRFIIYRLYRYNIQDS